MAASSQMTEVKSMVKEVFLELSDNKKTIRCGQLHALLVNIGINMTEAEIKDMCHRMNIGKKDPITFPVFFATLEETINEISVLEELPEVYKAFCDKNGCITKVELKKALRNLGTLASSKEIESMMRAVLPKDVDKIDYERFVQIVRDCINPTSASGSGQPNASEQST